MMKCMTKNTTVVTQSTVTHSFGLKIEQSKITKMGATYELRWRGHCSCLDTHILVMKGSPRQYKESGPTVTIEYWLSGCETETIVCMAIKAGSTAVQQDTGIGVLPQNKRRAFVGP